MRHFIIKSFETIIWIVGALITAAGVIAGLAMIAQGDVTGLLLIIFAPLYAVLVMGMFFIFIAISDNTKRTAEAVEKLASK